MRLRRSMIRNIATLFLCLLFLGPVTHSQALVSIPTASLLATAPPPYMEYRLYNDTVIDDPVLPPVLANGFGDYAAIFQRHHICQLVASGAIDEVWIWAGTGDGVTKPHLLEWTTSGPGWTDGPFWNVVTPDCGKDLTTMTFNYEREVDSALHSFGHRIEGAMMHYRPCDFSTSSWPWQGSAYWSGQCDGSLSDSYGYVARAFAGNNQIAGCGDIHHPPNITSSEEYNYASIVSVPSICQDWSRDGTAQVTPLTCAAWGCTEWGYMVWWMQNLPGYDNTNRVDTGSYQPNWWPYLFGMPTAAPPTAATPLDTATSTPMPTTISTATATALPLAATTARSIYIPLLQNTQTTKGQAPQVQFLATQVHSQLYSHRAEHRASVAHGIITAQSNQPALAQHTVLVIGLSGYGGTPRADMGVLTTELTALLKQASVYHGYNYSSTRAIFLGQDGASYAGQSCTIGTAPDNIHIRVEGLPTDKIPVSYRVTDPAGAGVWATPCNPVSSWELHVISGAAGTIDLYVKPFRNAPAGTIYSVTMHYDNETDIRLNLIGTRVQL